MIIAIIYITLALAYIGCLVYLCIINANAYIYLGLTFGMIIAIMFVYAIVVAITDDTVSTNSTSEEVFEDAEEQLPKYTEQPT